MAASVHASFATWLHGDGKFCRADHCEVAVATWSAWAINIQTRTKATVQGAKTDIRCHGCWLVQFLHVHALVHLQIAAIDVEHVPRRSRRGLCRLTVDYGNRGHCAKLDKPITVLYIAHTVSSGARDVAAERRFLDIIWWHLMLPHPSLLPSSFCTLLAATYVN